MLKKEPLFYKKNSTQILWN